MTQEQYNRAVEINKRLEEFEEVRIRFKKRETFLCYGEFGEDGMAYNSDIGSYDVMEEILDRHNRMIQGEIDEEIVKLKNEIEEL